VTRIKKLGVAFNTIHTLLARRKLLLLVLVAILVFVSSAILTDDLFGTVDPRVYAILSAYVVVMLLVLVYSIAMHFWEARSVAVRKGITLFEQLQSEIKEIKTCSRPRDGVEGQFFLTPRPSPTVTTPRTTRQMWATRTGRR
jgi:hypothetical protein